MRNEQAKRAIAVRAHLADQPPATSEVIRVLHLWTLGKDTACIADLIGTSEPAVARIIAADQDCRRLRRHRAA